ncbi:helix-turn-helix transcriptional regulator [Bordetella genomosp. 10]|nr:AraC family transcriptional regulator [Bordetella genomosp. 10]
MSTAAPMPPDEARLHGHHLLPDVVLPGAWAGLAQFEDFDDDITLTAWRGRATEALDVQAEGPPMFCIAVFLEGRASMAIDGGPPLLAEPGMAVIQTGERRVRGSFRMAGGQDVQLVDIRYTPAGLLRAGGQPLVALQGDFLQDRSVPAAGSLLAGFPAPAALLRTARDILACPYRNRTVRQLYLRAKALEALAVVLQAVQQAGDAPVGARERRLLLQARRLIDERYGEDWTVERLARAVGLTEKKLKAGFRALAGHTVHAYLREVRLQAAACMLDEGHSATEAALAVGYSNLSHFSKSFREVNGMGPRHWARRREG